MKYVTKDDLENIAIGATLLGSGGGGDPEYDRLRCEQLIEQHGFIRIISVDDLDDDALVVPVGFMGAPLVSVEKLPSGKECVALFRAIERRYGRKIDALVATEIGGSNAFAPLAAALEAGLPVIDGDTIGRAFPQLEMSTCNLTGVSVSPAFMADSFGSVTELECRSAEEAEKYFRALCTAMGSTAAVVIYIMTGKEAKRAVLRGTLSRTWRLGAGEEAYGANPVASGIVTDIDQTIDGGFLRGQVIVETNAGPVSIHFQNEYLMVFHGKKVLAETPDIIAIIDVETGLPLAVEQVKFGLRVDVVSVPCDPIWKTEQGLQLVGPKAFGYV